MVLVQSAVMLVQKSKRHMNSTSHDGKKGKENLNTFFTFLTGPAAAAGAAVRPSDGLLDDQRLRHHARGGDGDGPGRAPAAGPRLAHPDAAGVGAHGAGRAGGVRGALAAQTCTRGQEKDTH